MRYGKRVAAIAVVASLVLVACGDDDEESGTGDTTAPEGTTAATRRSGVAATPRPGTTARHDAVVAAGESLLGGEIPCDQQYAGKTVSVLSPVRNSENDPDADRRSSPASGSRSWIAPGVKIDFQGTDQFEVQVAVLHPGRQPARRDRLPAAGSVAHAGAASLITFPDDLAAHVNSDFIAGWDELGTVDGEVKGMPWRANVKSMVWYSPAAFEARRLRGPRDARRAEGAVRPDRRRRRHPVVRRHRVGRGHRMADHRLVRGLHAAPQRSRGVRPVGQPRDPVQRPEGQGRRRRGRRVPEEPRLHGRREQRQGDRHDEVPGRRRADHHRRLLHAPPGELLQRRCSPRARRSARPTATATSRSSTCPSPRPATRR